MREHPATYAPTFQAAPVISTGPGAELAIYRPEATAHAHAAVVPAGPLPGAELFTVPGVGQVWGYPDRRFEAAPAPAVEPLPTWVKSVALLMPSAAASVALGAWGLSLAVSAFEAITAALWALAGATATVGLVVGGTALALRSATAHRKAASNTPSGPATATATATATGRSLLGGKTTATATATVQR